MINQCVEKGVSYSYSERGVVVSTSSTFPATLYYKALALDCFTRPFRFFARVIGVLSYIPNLISVGAK